MNLLPPAIPRLDYAPASHARGQRLKRLLRRLFVAALVLSNLYFAVTKWGGRVRLQTHMLICQRLCMRFAEPPTRVVFENDPAKASVWLSQAVYGPPRAGPFYFPMFAVYLRTGEIFDAFGNACTAIEAQQPIGVPLTSGMSDISPDTTGWKLFMSRRRSPSGHNRLVIVRGGLADSDPDLLSLEAFAIEPASLTGLPHSFSAGELRSLPMFSGGGPHHPLCLFAGQADAKNRARFTIAYDTPDGHGTVEGILGDDDGVRLKILDGPLTSSDAPPSAATEP